MTQNKILFYDSEYTGHHTEYILHLINYANRFSIKAKLFFVVHSFVYDKYLERFNESPQFVYVEPISDQFESENLTGFNGFKRAVSEIKVVNYYTDKFQVDNLFLLKINPFLLGLVFPVGALRLRRKNISGILFHPAIRIHPVGWKAIFKSVLKKAVLYGIPQNLMLEKVFILNDQWSVDKLNKVKPKKDIFAVLPDPVNMPMIPQIDSKRDKRKVLLFFGYINKRKGILNLLDALSLLSKPILGNIKLLIYGQIDSQLEKALVEKIVEIQNFCPELIVELNNDFVSEDKVISLFQNCDLVLAPYINSSGSSGMLGWAAAAGKPVLTSNRGLIGELVSSYKLGISVNAADLHAIKSGLEKFYLNNYFIDKEGQQRFLSENSADLFAETIFSSFK